MTARGRTEAEAFVENHGSEEIEVCSDCERACCWQGILMCDNAVEAGTKTITVEEAAELGLEHFDYWKNDLDQQRENAPEPEPVVHHKKVFKAKRARGLKQRAKAFAGKVATTEEKVENLSRAIAGGQAREKNLEARIARIEGWLGIEGFADTKHRDTRPTNSSTTHEGR